MYITTSDAPMSDAPASVELPAPETPAAGPSDNNSRKRSREPDDEAPTGDNDTLAADDANPSKRPRNDEGPDSDNEEPEALDAAETAGADNNAPKQLSKNQLRKQRRQQKFLDRKEIRKQQRKDKRHERVARKRDERETKAEELAKAQGIDFAEALKQVLQEFRKKKNPRPVPISIIIDCDFEKYVRDNELVSLANQVTRSYSMNRNGEFQAHLLVSSWGGKMRERFEDVLESHHKHWKGVSFVEGDFVEAGKKAWEIMHSPKGGKTCPALGEVAKSVTQVSDQQSDQELKGAEDQGLKVGDIQTSDAKPTEAKDETMDEAKDDVKNEASEAGSKQTSDDTKATPPFSTDSIIYLSADSDHTLDKLEPNTSYVIGGLVDRNREKYLCQRRAEGMGIRTAKLPIGEYMQMSSRKVLATNHVVEIISKWLETGDWAKAFLEVIPKRKGGQLKDGEDGDDDDQQHDEKDEVDGTGGKDADDQEMVDVGAENVKNGEKQEDRLLEAEA